MSSAEYVFVCNDNQFKFLVNLALDSMRSETEIDELFTAKVDVILIENIVQTFVKVFHVEQDNTFTSFHANLYTVDVSTDLKQDK